MRLWSEAWPNGEPIPERFAAASIGADGAPYWSPNLSPPLAWSGLPAGTRSLVLIGHDFDFPVIDGVDLRSPYMPRSAVSREMTEGEPLAPALGGSPWMREFAAAHDRQEFFLWVLVDLPPDTSAFTEGQFGHGFVAGGRRDQRGPGGARAGVNDFTGLFAGRPGFEGCYRGYDGPLPPPGDALVHHIVFALFALDVVQLTLPESFGGPDVRAAIAGHVLGSATHSGTCTLNPRLAGSGG
jgi:phosphatidylethanolamine-binding protein (PEBP) family uncharacterized protein